MESYLTGKLFLPIILGTNRKERKSLFVAEWLMHEISKRSEIETRLFDVKDFALPHHTKTQF
jgi:NAD(P)H-dependent FMN reductase